MMRKLKIAVGLVTLFLFASIQTFAQTQAAAVVPGILPAFITAGIIDPNGKVPALNAVPGSGVANLSEAMPLTILNHGNSYSYLVALQDYNFTGTCVVSFKLTQLQNGNIVTLDSGTIKTFDSSPGQVWAWVKTGKPIPNAPGIATLMGSVKYGTKTVSVKTTVVLQ